MLDQGCQRDGIRRAESNGDSQARERPGSGIAKAAATGIIGLDTVAPEFDHHTTGKRPIGRNERCDGFGILGRRFEGRAHGRCQRLCLFAFIGGLDERDTGKRFRGVLRRGQNRGIGPYGGGSCWKQGCRYEPVARLDRRGRLPQFRNVGYGGRWETKRTQKPEETILRVRADGHRVQPRRRVLEAADCWLGEIGDHAPVGRCHLLVEAGEDDSPLCVARDGCNQTGCRRARTRRTRDDDRPVEAAFRDATGLGIDEGVVMSSRARLSAFSQ